ncbi:oxysterol-binding protein-related protein 7 isoform X1 [Megalops cyprinoides]|uniref:oxysterol-binding protein-related protein 7 isoform X1 n=1 Tax=Megalops cyprinoides TaxID=118141 RepID=UPI001864B11E|nr:oxysterol-binding protein-related protein 7 isoform X1 [Megalops cyprinoides]
MTKRMADHKMNIKDWEVMDDMHMEMCAGGEMLQDMTMPGICEGYLMKKRKWPLKGWHKRYFVLDKGVLKYSKTQQDIAKGKLHGSLDVSLAVMSINKKSKRIDLDAGDSLYHMKAKNHELFYIWVTKLSAHRVFKKNEAVHVHNGFLQALSQGGNVLPSVANLMQQNGGMSDMPSYPHYQSNASTLNEAVPPLEELPAASRGVNSKVSAWLQQTQDVDCCFQELNRCQSDLAELNRLVQRLQALEGGQSFNNGELQRIISMQNLTLEKPKKKSNKIWGHSRTLSRVEALGMLSSSHLSSSSHLGTSVPSIPDYVYSQLSPPSATSPEGKKIQQDICTMSQRVHASLKTVHEALVQERQRLQVAWNGPELHQSTSQQLATLCTTLSELKLQSHLTKIHSLSVSSDSSEESFCTVRAEQPARSVSSRRSSRHAPSVADSTAEYFDACDHILCGSSSENEASGDESGLSDITTSNSEPEEGHETATLKYRKSISTSPDMPSAIRKDTGRRTTLPAPCPNNSHIGLMTILYNNIGKDLSRVSMPIPLNEPVSLLQRLCEELEYSDLLDTASHTEDPYERMVYIAAFAISGYATARFRNRYKPFNPVLGETYECVREDRGFRYISEQVCHHPPISACHADAENFSFWQDQRWKNKFWGKSLEIMPTGMVNVTLPRFNDHYEWNKVVTCIHNVLSQQRYLEHYGEVIIRNLNSTVCTCKITFVKSRYWSSDSHLNEVQGVVLDQAGNAVHRFGGLWHEGIFCDTLPKPQCLWKPNPQPKDYIKYYGLSSFAMELNELTPELKPLLPPTDTRLRPDQRMLEEGQLDEAEKRKDEIEEKQRERRKILAKKGEEHIPRFFRKSLDAAGREVWLTNGTYWKIRENPGFASTKNLDLW